jgi:chitin disaccharide deacetylase
VSRALHVNTPEPAASEAPVRPEAAGGLSANRQGKQSHGTLILNADDWGRDRENTDKILVCQQRGALSSVSAMMYMQDSERGAALAREKNVDAGLHLNLTSPFTALSLPANLAEQQLKIARYLRRNGLAPAVFHPGLRNAFDYVVNAQLDEFARLYGKAASRIDGHHHMHLAANVLYQKLLPAGTIVRRNFSFRTGEKNWANRKYRALQDRSLARRHRMTDFFFALPPLEHQRVRKIFLMAETSAVEVETHPVVEEEFQFLSSGEIFAFTGGIAIEPTYQLPARSARESHQQA